jgi:hypothetical protein
MDATECSFSKYLLVLAFFLPSFGCASLKSNSGSTPPPKSLNVSIQLSQSTVSLQAGAKQQFSAVVQGSSNSNVKWSVDNVAGGNSASGTIDATGHGSNAGGNAYRYRDQRSRCQQKCKRNGYRGCGRVRRIHRACEHGAFGWSDPAVLGYSARTADFVRHLVRGRSFRRQFERGHYY